MAEDKIEEKKEGRPPELTEDGQTNFAPNILAKLESAFLKGMNKREACFLANIDESTFYRVVKKNPDLLVRFELLQENVKVRAKEVVAEAIDKGDKQQANWYLERKSKDEFSTRNEFGGVNGAPIEIKQINYVQPAGTDNNIEAGTETASSL